MSSRARTSRFRIPADHTAVPPVREALARQLHREGWADEATGIVLLALSEALSNAIDHGSPRGGTVDVELVADHDMARFTVRDRGRRGERCPLATPRAPAPTALRGRGLIIMERLADHLERRAMAGGTEIIADFHAATDAVDHAA
ncbi:MAG TPA: ATP-binding protein [Miltoncostaeaceae bacterium]|nr:ATP-binding protein [Miltoncostaeaceae bacterium]